MTNQVIAKIKNYSFDLPKLCDIILKDLLYYIIYDWLSKYHEWIFLINIKKKKKGFSLPMSNYDYMKQPM